jgi:hypothetical protein
MRVNIQLPISPTRKRGYFRVPGMSKSAGERDPEEVEHASQVAGGTGIAKLLQSLLQEVGIVFRACGIVFPCVPALEGVEFER